MTQAKKSFKDYTSIGSISTTWILKNLPFVAFLGFMTTIYIANVHFAERNVREIQVIQKELKDLRREYNSLKAEIMFEQRMTEVSKSVKPLNLEVFNKSPKKIIVKE